MRIERRVEVSDRVTDRACHGSKDPFKLEEAEEAKLLNEQKVREDNTVSDDDLPF